MTISEAMDNLVEEVRAIGLGEYFDGLDYDDIIVNALDAYRRDIIARADEILEDMYPDGIDSESDEPKKKTRDEMLAESEDNYKCPQCGTDCTATTCSNDGKYWCDICEMDVDDEGAGNCPNCGHWLLPEDADLIEETDYLEEEEDV